MKKITALFLCMVLLCAMALPVSAAAYMSISASSSTVYRGDSFTLTVSLSNDQPVSNGAVILSYDAGAFEMVGGSCNVSGAAVSQVSTSIGGGTFAMETDAVVSGTIFTFNMKVKSGAAFGTYTISGSPSLNIDCGLGGTSVTVGCSHSYGAASRVDDASHRRTCSICGGSNTEEHSWNGGETLEAPTCQQTGSAIYTCTVCGATVTGSLETTAHSYESTALDDASHELVCVACGLRSTEDHQFDDVTEYDETGHFQNCVACGHKVSLGPHTPGPEATQTTDQVCTECGWVLQPMGEHTHYFTKTWLSDPTDHYHKCSGCDEKKDFAAHSYDSDCDTDCNVCHLRRQTEHLPKESLTVDETGHWFECTVCGEKLEQAAHIPGPEATITAPQTCTECGYEIAPIVPHDHVFDTNGTLHFHECICGERYQADRENCTICAEMEEPFPWHTVCIALAGVVLILLIAVVVLAVLLGRKKTEFDFPKEKKSKKKRKQDTLSEEEQPKEEWVFE